MVARVGAMVGTLRNDSPMAIRARPVPRPIRAVASGRPMATTEPNATSRTMIATARPITSLLPPISCSPIWISPPNSTV